MRNWTDGLEEALAAAHVPGKGRMLLANYRDAFPVDYREVYPPATAVADIQVVETLTAEHPLGVELYRSFGAEATSAGLKVFSHSRPIALSERVPVLENMGFRVVDERTYHIEPQDAADVWFHDMTLESAMGSQAASTWTRYGKRSRPASSRSWADAPRMTAITRWCWRPGWSGAMLP